MDKAKKIIIIVVITILLGGILFLTYYLGNKNNSSNNINSNINWSNKDKKTISSSDEDINITDEGVYTITGNVTGTIYVNASDKDVKIILDNTNITSNDKPAIYIEKAKSTYIELVGDNTINTTTSSDLDGAIYSKDDLYLSGTGSLKISSNYDGIVSKDNLVISSGTYDITSTEDAIKGKDSVTIEGGTFTINAKDDGIHSDGMITINNGNMNITASEGIEATYVKINDGTIYISASDDGINASNKSEDYDITVEINGGNITIEMGAGDTDGIDSNGNLYINGGTLNITGSSPFDYDKEAKYTGGKMIVNGEETTTITNQFAGMSGGQNMNGGDMPGRGDMPQDNQNMQGRGMMREKR